MRPGLQASQTANTLASLVSSYALQPISYGQQDLIKDGPRILSRDCILGPMKSLYRTHVLLANIDRGSLHMGYGQNSFDGSS